MQLTKHCRMWEKFKGRMIRQFRSSCFGCQRKTRWLGCGNVDRCSILSDPSPTSSCALGKQERSQSVCHFLGCPLNTQDDYQWSFLLSFLCLPQNSYFHEPSLLSRVPSMLQTLALLFLTLQAVGLILIQKPSREEEECLVSIYHDFKEKKQTQEYSVR